MSKHEFPSKGLEVWKNDKNNFFVFQLHYSADPDKRSEDWKQNAKSGMPIRDWQQEYEIQWFTYEGLPVYGDWNEKIHAVPGEILPEVKLPLLIGWDFGLTPAAVIAQLQGERLMILREFVGFNIGAERFTQKVVPEIRQLYPEWGNLRKHWLCYIDPSGEFRKDTDEGTCAQILDKVGFNPIAGPVAFEARKQSVERFLTKMVKAGPCFQVSAQFCPTVIEGFRGGYMYPDKAKDIEPGKLRPVKNKFSHPHDALQYLCSGILETQRSYGVRVPAPTYAWQSRNYGSKKV